MLSLGSITGFVQRIGLRFQRVGIVVFRKDLVFARETVLICLSDFFM